MPRAYQMDLTIEKYNQAHFNNLVDAIEDVWGGWREGDAGILNCGKGSYFWSGPGNLYDGETPEHFANRVAQRLWQVNGGPLDIKITAYLEIDPEDYFEFDVDTPPQ